MKIRFSVLEVTPGMLNANVELFYKENIFYMLQ